MAHIDRIEANERHEEPDVRFGQLWSSQEALLLQNAFQLPNTHSDYERASVCVHHTSKESYGATRH